MALRSRDLGSLALCLVAGALALGPLPQLPVLAVVDLGFASVGHAVGGLVAVAVDTPVLPSLGGLVVPVAVPLALAVRFLPSRPERHAAALCLAWAATVLTALAAAVTEAAEPGPAPDGSAHDWAVVLGPRGLRALAAAADVTVVLRTGAVLLLVGAVVLCAAPLVTNALRAAPGPSPAAAGWDGPHRRRLELAAVAPPTGASRRHPSRGTARGSASRTWRHTWSAPAARCSATMRTTSSSSPHATMASTSRSLPGGARSSSDQPRRRRLFV